MQNVANALPICSKTKLLISVCWKMRITQTNTTTITNSNEEREREITRKYPKLNVSKHILLFLIKHKS